MREGTNLQGTHAIRRCLIVASLTQGFPKRRPCDCGQVSLQSRLAHRGKPETLRAVCGVDTVERRRHRNPPTVFFDESQAIVENLQGIVGNSEGIVKNFEEWTRSIGGHMHPGSLYKEARSVLGPNRHPVSPPDRPLAQFVEGIPNPGLSSNALDAKRIPSKTRARCCMLVV
jgi:hypothetical protein